ncbi:MAG: CPBP family intramembrane glutamic endopeptidase [Actinomycetota bacterium]
MSASAAAAVGGGLAAYNVALHRVIPRRHHLATNLVATALLVGSARAAGMGATELGLAREQHRRGLREGLIASAAVVTAVALAASPRRLRRRFADDRVRARSGREAAYESLARIPLGTALFEEVAFRGVLTGLLRRDMAPAAATAVSTGAFGLWHVLPTLDHRAGSPLLRSSGPVAAGLGAVAATVPAGVAFEALRRRSDSLLAPVLVHAALNSSTYLAAQVAHREQATGETA